MFVFPALILSAMLLFLLTTAMPVAIGSKISAIEQGVEIVRGRFARGEIDAVEYDRIVKGLTSPQ